MKLKRLYQAFLVGVFMLSGMYLANAQTMNPASVQCGALSGSPFMCVKNASHYPIVDITTVVPSMYNPTYVPSSWIHIPGGAISPGGTTVVKFNTTFFGPGCVQTVLVRTATGQTHPYKNVDVCRNTSLTVADW